MVDLAPESMTLSHIGGPSNTTLLAVHADVKGYVEKMKVLIDSGASSNYARRASLNTNKEVLGSAERTHISDRIAVRLATGKVVETQRVEVDLRLRFLDFDSVERFIALDLDERYDLILGMSWLVKHEPWINWKSKSIGASTVCRMLSDTPTFRPIRGLYSRQNRIHQNRMLRDTLELYQETPVQNSITDCCVRLPPIKLHSGLCAQKVFERQSPPHSPRWRALLLQVDLG
jgi:hypothetical protein